MNHPAAKGYLSTNKVIYSNKIVTCVPEASSVGRAIDCRSIGHWFDSGVPDIIRKRKFLKVKKTMLG